MAEPYNGWVGGRETWSLALWLNSDAGLYHTARDIASGATDVEEAKSNLKHWVCDVLWDELGETPGGRLITKDVGSLWRVDWDELTASFRDE